MNPYRYAIFSPGSFYSFFISSLWCSQQHVITRQLKNMSFNHLKTKRRLL